jgi:hypothetical protein
MWRSSHVVLLLAGLVGLASSGCHKSKQYESEVEITGLRPVRKDEAGKPLTTDAEFSYANCPGMQIETVRGDTAFSTCIARYSVGQNVKLKLEHHWHEDGHYVWTVHKVGDCDRVVDPNDEASHAFIRDCEDWKVNGAKVGFTCDLKAEKALLDKCPWFRKH